MNKNDVQKKIVLGILFIFPLLVYLFFASGVNNFAKLPVLNNEVKELDVKNQDIRLKDHITILGYWGGSLENKKAEALNLNEKIYKRFYQFEDFQFVFFVDSSRLGQVDELKKSLKQGAGTDLSRWNFIPSNSEYIKAHFSSLKTPFILENDYSSPYVFIIDKDLRLRGRDNDNDSENLYGFDARSVAQINKKMIDDVKVILAEYRLALKIYNTKREK
tara:strand:+ start:1214 stop:1867 length:654 start_codon:yes stop_codon:yes gene_type:complete